MLIVKIDKYCNTLSKTINKKSDFMITQNYHTRLGESIAKMLIEKTNQNLMLDIITKMERTILIKSSCKIIYNNYPISLGIKRKNLMLLFLK